MDKEFENVKRDKIREQMYLKLAPQVLPILNTELGKALVKEDVERFIYMFEEFLGKELKDITPDFFAELKYLHNRIVASSKRIEKYLELDK